MAALRLPMLALLTAILCGCNGVTVIPAGDPTLFDSVQASVSTSSDELSPRTLQTLRRCDLEPLYRHDALAAYRRLQGATVENPEPERLFALAEMSYLFGKNAEKSAPAEACAFYYFCAGYSYHYLFDFAPEGENPFDPRFRLACDLYNTGLGKCIRAAQRAGRLDARQELQVPTPDGRGYRLSIRHHGFAWLPEEFGPLLFCSDFNVVGLANHHRSYGLGVPLIGTHVAANTAPGHAFYPREISFPVTAFFRFEGSLRDLHEHRSGRLELYNPLEIHTVRVGERPVPLETDLTTPLAYFLSRSDLEGVEYAGFLTPAKVEKRSGIYMFEPYCPGKVPVLMVHGLLSSPLTWSVMFNDLRADPILRERFQFWFYLYPTGNPYLETAADLREDLDRLRAELDPQHQDAALDHLVLVGHSMGGLVSKLLTVDSGEEFWSLVSREPFNDVKTPPETRERLKRIFFFDRRPDVDRVVFMATPHHGSKLSPSPPGRLAASLIELPKNLRQSTTDLKNENPKAWTAKLPTSVDLLAPGSPALEVLASRPKGPGLHYHSIIGQAPHGDALREVGYLLGQTDAHSDGAVPYTSSHIDNAESEVIVDADHNQVHRDPRAVLEVRRILLEHWTNLQRTAQAGP